MYTNVQKLTHTYTHTHIKYLQRPKCFTDTYLYLDIYRQTSKN